MKIDILTLFPEFTDSMKTWSIISRGIESGLVEINSVNIRDFSANKHKKVDDYPYGGGPGMVMTPQPLYDALKGVNSQNKKTIYLSPMGKPLNQEKLMELSKEKELVLLCGHYEGIDQRIIDNYVDEEISIGDFILTGGELPAMVLIDGIVRLIPGVLNNEDSSVEESFSNGLLEHNQYTRPEDFMGHRVPEVLLSGNHKKIDEYKIESSIRNTLNKRPDLIDTDKLSKEELEVYKGLRSETNK
ncbi:MAG: tRNA (guanosine(37)-N1)-methyltransferase TrmD [Tissierellia bacterium]|nr:tRNA (guanosine(37)-N1)-methyltransferase TrmD [Tissierellia bacterium]